MCVLTQFFVVDRKSLIYHLLPESFPNSFKLNRVSKKRDAWNTYLFWKTIKIFSLRTHFSFIQIFLHRSFTS